MKDSKKKMLGLQELKEKIEITPTTVDCPVKGCKLKVKKMSRGDSKLLDAYLEKGQAIKAMTSLKDDFCKEHKIWITPSTFIYGEYMDNLLWREEKDVAVLKNMLLNKRVKAQLYHDNSEDAVTWNVFRYLEKSNLMGGFLSQLTGATQENAEVIYWSYNQKEGNGWTLLDKARAEFGEKIERGSEPDIIVKTDKTLFFIEAKLTSGNETTPSDKNNPKKYETGGNTWFREAFTSDYKTIAITEKKYELMRFWLLGTWMAEQAGLGFYLINLVPEGKEQDIESLFRNHIKESPRRKFLRLTWENIYQYVSEQSPVRDKDLMIRFFKNKTFGYRNGVLQKAFSICQ